MKTAFITGGNQGLGSGFVDQLLENGWKVFASTRKKDVGLRVHENLEWLYLELEDDRSIDEVGEYVVRSTDTIDLLINNVGVNKDTATGNKKEKVCTLANLDRAMLLRMFNVNAVAPMLILKKLLPLLNGSPSFVINISSGRASYQDETPNEFGNYGYRGSKAALNMFTFCSLKDLPEHVKTFAVHPGSVKSQMNPSGESEPKDAARMILSIAENWNDEWNGKFMRYDGTLYPL